MNWGAILSWVLLVLITTTCACLSLVAVVYTVAEHRERKAWEKMKFTPPRYDEVFFSGVEELDRLAKGDDEKPTGA